MKTKNVVIKKTKAASKSKWKNIHELRKKITDTESKLAKLASEKKAYYEQASAIIADSEMDHSLCVKNMIIELIRFIPYKTLSEKRLEGLILWIDELKALINENPFNIGERRVSLDDVYQLQENALKARLDKFDQDPALTLNPNSDLNAQINNLIKLMLDNLNKQYSVNLPLFNKTQCMALLTTPALRTEILTNPLFQACPNYVEERNALGEFEFTREELFTLSEAVQKEAMKLFAEEFGSREDEEEFGNFDFNYSEFEDSEFHQHSNNDESIHSDAEKLLDNEEINKLYRQLAHKFHPDKLTEENDRALYLELMKQLSSAKKTKNFHVIIELAMTYLPDLAIDLSNDTFALMEQSLKKKLGQIQAALDHEKHYDNSPEGLVWEKFKAKTQKQVEKNMQAHKASLQARIVELNDYVFSKPLTIKKINEGIDELLLIRSQDFEF